MNDLLNLPLAEIDPLIANAIDNEVARQANGLELIASENFVSEAVLEAMGSVLQTSMPKAIPANVTTAVANGPTSSNRRRSIAPKNSSKPTTLTCKHTVARSIAAC